MAGNNEGADQKLRGRWDARLGAVAASQRCIRTRTGRMDLKELTWRAVSPACALGEDGG